MDGVFVKSKVPPTFFPRILLILVPSFYRTSKPLIYVTGGICISLYIGENVEPVDPTLTLPVLITRRLAESYNDFWPIVFRNMICVSKDEIPNPIWYTTYIILYYVRRVCYQVNKDKNILIFILILVIFWIGNLFFPCRPVYIVINLSLYKRYLLKF